MKLIIPCFFILLLSCSCQAQEGNFHGSFAAVFDSSTGMITYTKSGEMSPDGIAIIDLKVIALETLTKMNSSQALLTAVEKEKQGLENLRKRILIQRERLMKPAPPLEEMH